MKGRFKNMKNGFIISETEVSDILKRLERMEDSLENVLCSYGDALIHNEASNIFSHIKSIKIILTEE
jgi:exonuclease VII small subunit